MVTCRSAVRAATRVPNPDLVRMIILPQHRSDNRSALPHFGPVARPHRESKWGRSPPLRAGATTALNLADSASPDRATRRSASGKGSRESPRVAGGRLVLPDLADPIDLDSQRNATFAIAACSPTGVTEGLVPATAVAPTMPRDPESIRAQIERAQEQGLEFED